MQVGDLHRFRFAVTRLNTSCLPWLSLAMLLSTPLNMDFALNQDAKNTQCRNWKAKCKKIKKLFVNKLYIYKLNINITAFIVRLVPSLVVVLIKHFIVKVPVVQQVF